MKLTISPTLHKLPLIDYRKVKELQGNLKDLTKENYARLLKSLTEFGVIIPLFIWRHEGEAWVIDGHQRIRVFQKEKLEPYELPYVEVEAANLIEAKKKLLVIASQYGRTSQDGFDELTLDIDDGWIEQTVAFDALRFAPFPGETPDGNAPIDEEKLVKTWNECPKCGFKW